MSNSKRHLRSNEGLKTRLLSDDDHERDREDEYAERNSEASRFSDDDEIKTGPHPAVVDHTPPQRNLNATTIPHAGRGQQQQTHHSHQSHQPHNPPLDPANAYRVHGYIHAPVLDGDEDTNFETSDAHAPAAHHLSGYLATSTSFIRSPSRTSIASTSGEVVRSPTTVSLGKLGASTSSSSALVAASTLEKSSSSDSSASATGAPGILGEPRADSVGNRRPGASGAAGPPLEPYGPITQTYVVGGLVILLSVMIGAMFMLYFPSLLDMDITNYTITGYTEHDDGTISVVGGITLKFTNDNIVSLSLEQFDVDILFENGLLGQFSRRKLGQINPHTSESLAVQWAWTAQVEAADKFKQAIHEGKYTLGFQSRLGFSALALIPEYYTYCKLHVTNVPGEPKNITRIDATCDEISKPIRV